MKKITAFFMCLILCLSFMGCDIIEKHKGETDPNGAQADNGSGTDGLSSLLHSREGYQLGTNCELKGNITVHLFFIDDQESRWDKDSAEQFTSKQILPGLDFLEKEANRYGTVLNFSVRSHTAGAKTGTPIKYDGKISKSKDHTADIPERIVGQLGYESKYDMYADMYGQNDHKEVIFMFVVNKNGVSYASKQVDGDFYHPSIEFCVIFKKHIDNDNGINTHSAATAAHEILHLYGAIDMYTPAEQKKLFKPIYPKDIMLLDYHDIGDMSVGGYTAYSVGWRDRA